MVYSLKYDGLGLVGLFFVVVKYFNIGFLEEVVIFVIMDDLIDFELKGCLEEKVR